MKDEKWELEKSINTVTERINDIGIFPNGNIITVSSNLMIKIFNEKGEEICFLSNAHELQIKCICVINDNEFLTGSNDKKIKYFKIENENKITQIEILEGHENNIMSIIYIDNKEVKNIISSGFDKYIKIWEKYINNKNNKFICLTTLKFHTSPIYSCIYLGNNIFISCEANDKIFIWENITYNKIKEIEGTIYNNNSLKKIDNENFIFGGGNDKIIKIINIKDGNVKFKAQTKCLVYAISINENYIFDSGDNPFVVEIRKKDLTLIKEINCINHKFIWSICNFNNKLIFSENEFLSIYKK